MQIPYELLFPLLTLIPLTGMLMYFIYTKAAKQQRLYRFVKQHNPYFFNKQALMMCCMVVVVDLLCLLGLVIFIPIGLVLQLTITSWVVSCLCIIYIIWFAITYWVWKSYASSILFIIKNKQIVIEDQVIDFADIHIISNDVKRKKILIHYINAEKEGKIITIRYNWVLKDLIIANEIKHNFI